MSKFLTELSLDATLGGWIHDEPFEYQSDYLGTVIRVPPGEFTDLATVPTIVPRFIVDVGNGLTREPAAVHDPLCRDEYKIIYGISQYQADRTFLEALLVVGVPRLHALVLFGFVAVYQIYKHKMNYWKALEA